MRRGIAALAAVVALSGTMAVTAHAQLPGAEPMRVDLFLKDADLVAATQMVTAKTGLQFVIKPSAKAFEKITMRLEGADPNDAIRYICQAAGAYFMRDESGVFIISREPFETKAVDVADPQAPVKRLVKRIKVQKADVRDVYDQVLYGAAFSATKPFEQLKKFARMSASHTGEFYKNVGLREEMQVSNYQPVDSRALPLTSRETGNNVLLPGEDANQRGGVGGGGGFAGGQGGGGIGGGGFGGQGGGVGGGFGGQGGGGIGGQGGGQLVGGQGLVPESIDFISYDPTDNSFVVRGTEEDINILQQRIALFDVAPKQVLIKVEFITVSSSLAKSLGFDWLFQRGTVFAGNRPGTFVRSSDPIFINYATGDITTRMRTLLTQGYGRSVQTPVIRTLNNQPASIFSQQTTTIFIGQQGQGAGGTVFTTYVPQQINLSTGIAVAPRIGDDGYITMFLQPQVQQLGQVRRAPDGGESPDFLSQFISVVARVRNNETVVLGGLTTKTETGSQAKFPILGDLPIIGQFFRASNRDVNNSELLIFVTPTVIEDDGTPINP